MRSSYSLPSRAAGIITAAFIFSLALAHIHPFGNADLFAAPRSQSPQLPASIPSDARAILASSCADCHSATARAPFYGHFAPVSWLLEHDIVEARDHLNLSNWDQYSPDQQQVLLAEISQQARGGHMPPPQYLLIHRNARLTAANVATLTAWTHAASLAMDSASPSSPGAASTQRSNTDGGVTASSDSIAMASSSQLDPNRTPASSPLLRGVRLEQNGQANTGQSSSPAPGSASAQPAAAQLLPGDPTRGADVFNRRCTGCHSLPDNREGPHLAGVYGRPSASIAGFPYSAALTAAHLTWNEETLNQWLTDPDAFIPGVNMDFRVPRPQERADIIAFLKASSSK